MLGLIGSVTNGGVEGITEVSHKKPPIKLAMKGKKWAIKAVILLSLIHISEPTRPY